MNTRLFRLQFFLVLVIIPMIIINYKAPILVDVMVDYCVGNGSTSAMSGSQDSIVEVNFFPAS